MEKIIEALVDELTARVLAKINEDTNHMKSFLGVRPKAEDIEGLKDFVNEIVDEAFDSTTVDVDARLSR